MKVEIELPDFEEVYCHSSDGMAYVSWTEIRKKIVESSISQFVDNLYDSAMNDAYYSTINDEIRTIVKNHSVEIITNVIEKVSAEILRTKKLEMK